jgi:hypothetical protein
VTATSATREQQVEQAERSWHLALLTKTEAGRRNRRPHRPGHRPTAFAIAITQRLCTFYLPPIWGYFSLRWLTRKGYV